jgi:flavin reductase (DIM6/NTAB) family NADH-FMN oxidoreductase RutF
MGEATARQVFESLEATPWLVTADLGGRQQGLLATFVAQASIVPDRPRVMVGLAKQHATWSAVEHAGRFGLHVPRADQAALCWTFGLWSGRERDKFAGLDWSATPGGVPRIADVAAFLECRVEARLDTGDRTIYLAEVATVWAETPIRPMTVKALFASADPATLERAGTLYARDSEVDRAAIDAWRATRGG